MSADSQLLATIRGDKLSDIVSVLGQSRLSSIACRSRAYVSSFMFPVASATWMKLDGGSKPRLGCSHRANTSHPTTDLDLQIDQRLVVGNNLAVLDCRTNLALQFDALTELLIHFWLEELIVVPAFFLGLIKTHIGLAHHRINCVAVLIDQRVGRFIVKPARRDPNAHTHPKRKSGELNWL